MTAPPDPGRLLAYVFWHWKQAAIEPADYESRQRDFHSALAAAPSEGFVASFSVALSGAPWAAGGGDAYEDWYLVRDFGALGALNEAAVTAGRALPHDAAAAAVADGAGGLCGLRLGAPGALGRRGRGQRDAGEQGEREHGTDGHGDRRHESRFRHPCV